MRPRDLSRVLPALILLSTLAAAPTPEPALSVAPAINALGLDLYRQQIKGADGETKVEMQRVLHFFSDQTDNSTAFHVLTAQLADMVRASTAEAEAIAK